MLDTNVASCIVRGASAVLARRLSAVPPAGLCVSSITRGELSMASHAGPKARGCRSVREFLVRLDVLAWDSSAATRCGALRAELKASGTPLGGLDTSIAAHALAEGATPVTSDQAFKRVPALVVENWMSA